MEVLRVTQEYQDPGPGRTKIVFGAIGFDAMSAVDIRLRKKEDQQSLLVQDRRSAATPYPNRSNRLWDPAVVN